MKSKVYLISGKAGHGKDFAATAAKAYFDSIGKKTVTLHFGDAVKLFAEKMMGYRGIKDEKDRHILQYFASDIIRAYDKFYWADIIGELIAATNNKGIWDVILIPDLRFVSEYESIRDFCEENNINYYTIRVNRVRWDGEPYVNPALTDEQRTHSSECELDDFDFDFVIKNDGMSATTLLQAVTKCIEQTVEN